MKRSRFIELFNSDNGILKIELKSQTTDYHFYTAIYLQSKFSHIFDKLNIKNLRLTKFRSKYSEVFDSSLNLNLNELYDFMVEEHNILGQNKTLYRLESKSGLGVYDSGGYYLFNEEHNKKRPDPFSDNKINHIFNSVNDYDSQTYKSEWKFAFSSLDELKNWIQDEKTFNNLKNDNRGYHIKEFLVPENMVIEGDSQIIFKDKFVRTSKSINLDSLNFDFKNRSKLKIN